MKVAQGIPGLSKGWRQKFLPPFNFLLLILAAIIMGAKVESNPQLMPGYLTIVPVSGSLISSQSSQWQVISPSGAIVASDSSPNNWSVTAQPSSNSFLVLAPASTPIGSNYVVQVCTGIAPGGSSGSTTGTSGGTTGTSTGSSSGTTGGTSGSTTGSGSSGSGLVANRETNGKSKQKGKRKGLETNGKGPRMSANVTTPVQLYSFVTGAFDVVPPCTTPPTAPTGLVGKPQSTAAQLSWSLNPCTSSYRVKQSFVSGGAQTVVATVSASTYGNTFVAGLYNATVTGLTNNLPYYYKISAVNPNGESPDSAEVMVTPSQGGAHLEINGVGESRLNGGLQLSVLAKYAYPVTSTGTTVINGITYTTSEVTTYGIALPWGSGPHVAGQPWTGVFFDPSNTTAAYRTSVADTRTLPNPVLDLIFYPVTGNDQSELVDMTGRAGQSVTVYLIASYHTNTYALNGSGTVVPITTDSYGLVEVDTYRLSRQNATGVSIDTRKTYGQPNLAGEEPGDPNAPPRNVNFYNWLYKGGLFVGSAPAGTGDQSGLARMQVYFDLSTVTYVNPVWSSFSTLYTGSPSGFTGDATYELYQPATSDPNLGVPPTTLTWASGWDPTLAQPRTSLFLPQTYPIGEFASFQNPGVAPKMLITLGSEQAVYGNSIPLWKYFASPPYSAAGIFSADDCTPRMWVVERTYGWPK
jgi:hypothetical protein